MMFEISRARLVRAVRILILAAGVAAHLPSVSSRAAEPAGEPTFCPASASSTATPPRQVIGNASWYGSEFANRPTASGEPFDPAKLTAAHRRLPLGTKVVVTNLHNGRSVLVTITDRGPYCGNREIDLSYRAAQMLGMVRRGVARVMIEPL